MDIFEALLDRGETLPLLLCFFYAERLGELLPSGEVSCDSSGISTML